MFFCIYVDIGSNIGPHSLTVAAMGREVCSVFFIIILCGRPLYNHLDLPKVVVLDAVFYNLALILQSHLRTGKGKVSIQH